VKIQSTTARDPTPALGLSGTAASTLTGDEEGISSTQRIRSTKLHREAAWIDNTSFDDVLEPGLRREGDNQGCGHRVS
jgi:hypothetical protein